MSRNCLEISSFLTRNFYKSSDIKEYWKNCPNTIGPHEDVKMKTFKRDFVRSMKYEKNIKDAAIVSFEELDVQFGDLIPNYKTKRESI